MEELEANIWLAQLLAVLDVAVLLGGAISQVSEFKRNGRLWMSCPTSVSGGQ